jgi:dihydroflavonol-4-reductase
MGRGTPGEEYIIASEARPLTEPFDLAESLTGIPATRTVPAVTFAVLARLMGLVERITTPPAGFEPELLSFAAGRRYDVDSTKAMRELGIEHRSLEAGLREYLAWELDQLGMDVSLDGGAA